jgi:hypothetical protein
LPDKFAQCRAHRNLITRRRMHLCMQDDQSGGNFMGLAPADTPFNKHKKQFLVVNDLVLQLGLHLLWNCLALHSREIVHFWLYILLLRMTILGEFWLIGWWLTKASFWKFHEYVPR